jgi:GNAT superfamily N-acetyltransferase
MVGSSTEFIPDRLLLSEDGSAGEDTVKTRWTPQFFAREHLRVQWPWELKANHRHRKDQPGIHIDEGIYVNQLRFHDSEGILRGILRLHHEPVGSEDEAEHDWDNWGHEPGFLWIVVDPEHLHQGIGMALLTEAFVTRRWPIDFGNQEYTPAGAQLTFKFRRLSGL